MCSTGLHVQKAYISLGTSSVQILLLSPHACMHFAWELQLYTQFDSEPTREFGVRIVAGST